MPESDSMTKRYFCTLFDSGYLVKGVAMIQSLSRHCPGAHVHVLCMDQQAEEILKALALPEVTCIPLPEIEDEALLAAKKDRSVAEYCWTLSPCLPWYVMQKYPHIDFITYLDADLLFYYSLQPLFDEIGNASIAIIEHRFSPRLEDRIVNGRFCVEWVSFRRDEQGMACLTRWRDQCIEWCYYRLEEGRMGDQKYLDEWPSRYPSCHILQHPGAGIAPWNYSQYTFGTNTSGQITVNGAPLIFYHFHQFQMLQNGRFDRLSTFYTSECTEPGLIYETYERTLIKVLADVQIVAPGFSGGIKSTKKVAARRWLQRFSRIQQFIPSKVKNLVRRIIGL
jgi:hypothetical protein